MVNELEERAKKRKARRNRRRLLSFLGFILLLIYIPALWNWFFSVNVEIGVIKTDTLEIKVPLKGVLIRKEHLLNSPGDGILIPAVEYGDKVAKGNEVVSFIQSDMRDVVENYRQMEIEILKRVVAEFDNTSGAERDYWEDAIEKQITRLTDISNGGDLSEAGDIRSSIDYILESKAHYMLENDSVFNKMENERNELKRLKNSIENSVDSIASPMSGVVSYQCDGFEEAITPEKRYDITLPQIDEIMGAESPMDKWLTPAEINVKKDQTFCKVIANDEAWITFSVPEKTGEELSVLFEKAKLEKKELTLEAELAGVDERIPVTIEKIGGKENGFQKMTARMTKYIEKTMDLRGVTGNLVLQSVTGMKVPLRSLFNINDVDNTADIAVVEMKQARFKRVQIAGQQESYAIIENLDPTDEEECVNVFDVYLVNPKNVQEGQVVEK